MNFRALKPEEIKVRVGNITSKGAAFLLYTEARTVMDILDETVGPENWECDYKEFKGVIYGGVGVNTTKGVTWKWDCGTESFSEAAKGEASDAFKRAAVRWGIARELYKGPKVFIVCPTVQKGDKYYLDDSVKDKLTYSLVVKEIEYDDMRNITKLVIAADYWDRDKKAQVEETVFAFPRNIKVKETTQKAIPSDAEMPEFPPAKISKGSADYLRELIKRTKTDEAKVLDYYHVEKIEDMTTIDFEKCSKILEARLTA